jgi:acyl-CoA synthetase (NDP forming)
MLEARSVALVGASPKFDTPGNHMVRQLVVGGFSGRAAAVNPRYEEVEGIACFPSLEALPFVPDLVLLGVGNHRLEEQMEAAARCGARGVVVFASALEDPPQDPPLTERLRRIAEDAGMAVCGANCMGFADVERGLRALAYEERTDLEPGNVAWIRFLGALARRKRNPLQPGRLHGSGTLHDDGRLHALRSRTRFDACDLPVFGDGS